MHYLRGMENVFLDLHLEKELIEKVADRIVEYDLGVIRNLAEKFPAHIQGLSFTDDWGTEKDLLINPEMWREFFKPRYARIFEAIHQAGWHVWMHSCGKINEIIQDLIDIGLDVINLQQPRVLRNRRGWQPIQWTYLFRVSLRYTTYSSFRNRN